jgi:prophage DNA circulation protein
MEMSTATFNGVPFIVATAELSGGRRGVTHEYPGRDLPFREDLGRAAREFPVDGYLVGEDVQAQRERLQAAFETEGPGELAHPYYGDRRVAVTSFRFRTSSTEGRFVSFSVEFVETPSAPAQPSAVPDAGAAALTSVTVARSSAVSVFLARYRAGLSMGSVETAAGGVSTAVRGAVAGVDMTAQARAELFRDVSRIAGLLRNAAALAELLVDVLDQVPAGALEVYRFTPGPPPPSTTANRRQELQNYEAFRALVQQLALLRAVELALAEDFDSYESAVASREELTEGIDEQQETAEDELYTVLVRLRADLVKAVPPTGLARIVTYEPPATVPSLVLAHQLYGGVAGEVDLVTRNNPARPGFLTGGAPLEVLSRV